jgi:hypothetical protein
MVMGPQDWHICHSILVKLLDYQECWRNLSSLLWSMNVNGENHPGEMWQSFGMGDSITK